MKWIALCAAMLSATSISANADEQSSDYDVIFAPSPQVEAADQAVLIGIERYLTKSIAVGAFGTILIREGTDEWQQVEVPTSVLLTGVSFADADHIWVSGHDGVILRSTDGGESWARIMDGFELLEQEYPWLLERQETLQVQLENTEDEDEAYEIEYLLDELSFQIQAAEIQQEVGPTKPFLDIHFLDPDHGFAIGAYGTFLETHDGGDSWDIINDRLQNPTAFHLNQMINNEEGDLFIIGEAGQLFRSEDDGQTWTMLDSPYPGSFFGGLFDQQGRLWVYGLRGNVYISDDNGDSFRQIEAPTRYNLNSGIVLADGTVVLAGHSGTLVFYDADTLEAERYEHRSSTPLSGLLQNAGNELALVGRAGLLQFMYPAAANR
jgi:photosystem II stability/assembly factor-like uncharacterized protein